MKEAPVGNICYLVFHAHLCPVGPRVLDSCSLTIRTIHIQEALWTPLRQSLIHFYFLGPQSSLGLYYYPVLMPCFTALFKIMRGAPVLFKNAECFCGIDKPSHTFGFLVITAVVANPGSVLEPANFVAGSLVGWPPEIFYESCDRFVVNASLGFELVFPRLIECVLLFVHPCRVNLSESRVHGYGRLGAQFLDHRQV